LALVRKPYHISADEISQPFVSKERHPHRQQERNGWYITTNSSTPFKKKQIEDLSKKFKLKLKVEIV
jgi:hypothetical protein